MMDQPKMGEPNEELARVQPQATDFTVHASLLAAVDLTDGETKPVVRIEIFTVTGSLVLFAKPDSAIDSFGVVLKVAETAKRSLIVPPDVLGDPDRAEDN